MDFFELMTIAHRDMNILNPSSPEKILTIGKMLELEPGNRVFDYGCGNGESFILWAKQYGISGAGIDIGEQNCAGAVNKIAEQGFADRFDIICGNANGFVPDRNDYDAAVCIGATFIWDGYRSAIQAMKQVVRPGGKLAIGEVYWLKSGIPDGYANTPGADAALFEHDILDMTIEEGYNIEYIVRSSLDDWDRYNTTRWHNLIRWIKENPNHPDRQEVIEHLHDSQDKYLRYEREYLGWAIYVLSPASY